MIALEELAKRYAKAIYQVALEKNEVAKILDELKLLRDSICLDRDIFRVFQTPVISHTMRSTIISDVLKGYSISQDSKNFLTLLSEKNRIAVLPAIVESYQALCDEAQGLLRGTVSSAAPLAEGQHQSLEQRLAERLGKKVTLTFVANPNLIGGVTVKIGGYVFDDSVDSHLKRLNEKLSV